MSRKVAKNEKKPIFLGPSIFTFSANLLWNIFLFPFKFVGFFSEESFPEGTFDHEQHVEEFVFPPGLSVAHEDQIRDAGANLNGTRQNGRQS